MMNMAPSTYSRKHYEQLADILLDVRRAIIGQPREAYEARTRQTAMRNGSGALAAIELIESRLARTFELDNPLFDAEKFSKASK